MAVAEQEFQAEQYYAVHGGYADRPSIAEEEMPGRKSGIMNDPMAEMQSRRFDEGDPVHVSQFVNGDRMKGDYTVSRCRYNNKKSYWEYRLVDKLGDLYNNKAWVPETDLKHN